MSFKKFGGLNYSAKNNIVGNLYSSSTNSGTANIIGLENSKITSQSHLDMSANSVMHIGSLYFMDGTIQSTAYANSSGTKSTFNNGIIVNNGSILNGGATINGDEIVNGDLNVTGTISLQGKVTASNGLTSSSGLKISEGSLIFSNCDVSVSNGSLTVSKGSTTVQDLTVKGKLSITGPLEFASLNLSNSLTVDKDTMLKGNLNSTGNSVLGTATIKMATIEEGGLTSNGKTILGVTNVNGELTTNSGLTTIGSGGLTSLDGKTILGSTEIKITQNSTTTIKDTGLIVESATTSKPGSLIVSSGYIYANGGAILSTYSDSSTQSSFNLLTGSTPKYISFGSDLGRITISSNLSAVDSKTGALVVKGGVGIQGDFYNVSETSGSKATATFDNLVVNGTLTFNKGSTLTVNDLNVEGELKILGNFIFNKNLSVGETLTVQRASHLNGGINVGPISAQVFSVDESGNTEIGVKSGTTAKLNVNGEIACSSGLTVSSGQTILMQTTATTVSVTKSLLINGKNINQIYQPIARMSLYSPLYSPTFTGIPKAPTAIIGTKGDQIATCDFVLENSGSSILSTNNTFTGTNVFNKNVTINTENFMVSKGIISGPPNAECQLFHTFPTAKVSIANFATDIGIGCGDLSSGSQIISIGFNGVPNQTLNIGSTSPTTKQTINIGGAGGSNLVGECVVNIGNKSFNNSTINICGTCTASSFISSSDYRIKDHVKNLDDEVNVDKLRPVTYTNKNTQKQDIGFIAHEVQEEFPHLVSGEKDGEQMQSLNYIGLIGILVKEIQELKKRVSILENK